MTTLSDGVPVCDCGGGQFVGGGILINTGVTSTMAMGMGECILTR